MRLFAFDAPFIVTPYPPAPLNRVYISDMNNGGFYYIIC